MLTIKKIFLRLLNKEIRQKIDNAKDFNELVLQNRYLSERELRQVYVDEYRNRLNMGATKVKINSNLYDFQKISEEESLFETLISNSNIEYRYTDYYNNDNSASISISFSDLEREICKTPYHQRLKAIQTNFEQLAKNISELELELSELNSLKCSELMQKVDLQECNEYKDLKIEPMIELFLLRGYIDENFYDYISYFYGNMISQNDWNFVLGVKLNRKISFDTHLDNVENCIAEIPDYAYKTKAILNIWVLHYLSNSEKYGQKMRQVVKTTMRNKSWDFLAQYYNTFKDDADVVFSYLFSQKTNFWEFFIGYTVEYQSILLEIWIKYAEIDKSTVNSKKWFAANYPYFLSLLPKVGIEHLQNLVHTHKYQFVELNKDSEELLDTIVETNSYEFNQKNILLIANHLLKKEIPNPSLNLTLIHETNNDTFIKNVIVHITVCLKNVFSEPASKEETPESIIELIENELIDEDTKKSYLKNQSNFISLSDIADEKDKDFALKQFLVSPNWNEIYEYHLLKGNSIPEELIRFIENFVDDLIKSPFPSEEIEKVLLHSLIATDTLPINVFRGILPVFKRWRFGGTDLSILPSDKIRLLLQNSMIKYNEFNTNQLLPFGDQIFAKYLLNHKLEYLKTPSDISYSKELVSILFGSTDLTIKEKSLLIPYVQENHLEDNQDLAEQIVIVLQQECVDLDYAVLCEILANSKQIEEKIHVINQTILKKDDITEEEIDTFLKTLPEPYCVVTKRGKNPAIPKKDYSMQLVEILDKLNYISSFTPEKDIIRIYTKKTK